jgi:hypothetical protein
MDLIGKVVVREASHFVPRELLPSGFFVDNLLMDHIQNILRLSGFILPVVLKLVEFELVAVQPFDRSGIIKRETLLVQAFNLASGLLDDVLSSAMKASLR